MMRQKPIITSLVLCFFASINAQNITDLSVMEMTDDASKDSVRKKGAAMDASLFPCPDRIKYDEDCFTIDGEDTFIFSGTFHYFRTPEELWGDRLDKLKEAGFNSVETYVPWNYHERKEPEDVDDYSNMDLSELTKFIEMAIDKGLYVIVRPGPYICAEWAAGGFPQWIMNKRPAETTSEVWLQSNDPAFVAWNKHWYDAVCKAIEPYQLTSLPKGSKGIILFQIENEYNRVKWVSSEDKEAYLADLAKIVRDNGINVPIITCWTTETRNSSNPDLKLVVDMVNSYPRWQIERNFGRLINQQLKTQFAKPLISGELQGGWYSDINGIPSWEQDGVAPVQTQNITLYALQRGFSGLNYYMAVGGTNMDDWASRGITTTYDFAAAVGENGSLNERYYRLQKLADFIDHHGVQIARAKDIATKYTSTDTCVNLAVREALNGDRYYFVRTEEHTLPHTGTIQTEDITLDYSLEPFGSMVYYLPNNKSEGEWWPKAISASPKSAITKKIEIKPVSTFADKLPEKWESLPKGMTIDQCGVLGHHPVYYRIYPEQGTTIEVERIAKGAVNSTEADGVVVLADGKLLEPLNSDEHSLYFNIPTTSGKEKKPVYILHDSKGIHHHTNKSVEENWQTGPKFVRCNGEYLPLEYAYTEKENGLKYSQGEEIRNNNYQNALLNWTIFEFETDSLSSPHSIQLEHTGNGFLYLNGHCLGRVWENGSQTDYYLPECWLHTDKPNHIAISLMPVENTPEIRNASIIKLNQ